MGNTTSASTGYTFERIDVPAMRVIGMRQKLESYQAQGALWRQFCGFLRTHKLTPKGPGMSLYYDTEEKQTDIDAELCFPIDEDAVTPPLEGTPYTIHELPELKQAVTTVHHGKFELLIEAYKALMSYLKEQKLPQQVPMREIYETMAWLPRNHVTRIIAPVDNSSAADPSAVNPQVQD